MQVPKIVLKDSQSIPDLQKLFSVIQIKIIADKNIS